MKYCFKALLILFCCTVQLKANPDNKFKEGYIISLKGDTTKGFLLAQESRTASDKCIFKPKTESESKIYQPGEITGYRYSDGKFYVSKEISIDSTTKKVVFLEFLIKGMANVYYYVDHKEHYYIEKFPNDLLELTEEQVTFYKDGRNYIIPPKYKGKLTAELNDCPDINRDIQNTRLTHKSLIKLTKGYHEKVCDTESCIVYEKGNISEKFKFGVITGLSKNQYNFGEQIISDYKNNYQIGVGLKISNLFMFDSHINLKVNFIFEKDSKSYTLSLLDGVNGYPVTIDNDIYLLNEIDYGGGASIPYLPSIKGDLEVTDLKIPISLNYDFNIGKKTIYTLGIGLSNKIILSQNKDFKVNYFYDRYDKSINSLLTGVIVSTGIEGNWLGKRDFFVNLSYEHLIDFRSKIDKSLKLLNDQFSLQIGIYL